MRKKYYTLNNKSTDNLNNSYYGYQDLYDYSTFDPFEPFDFDLNQEYQTDPDNPFNNDSQIELKDLQQKKK